MTHISIYSYWFWARGSQVKHPQKELKDIYIIKSSQRSSGMLIIFQGTCRPAFQANYYDRNLYLRCIWLYFAWHLKNFNIENSGETVCLVSLLQAEPWKNWKEIERFQNGPANLFSKMSCKHIVYLHKIQLFSLKKLGPLSYTHSTPCSLTVPVCGYKHLMLLFFHASRVSQICEGR